MGIGVWLGAIATLIAAFGGAWLAFLLERQRRAREEVDRRIGAANRALFTLFNFWNILYQHKQEVIDPVRGREDAWLNMPATFPSDYGLTRFEAGDLTFLLDSREADVFATLMVEEQRFHIAMRLIEEHASLVRDVVHAKFGAAGIAPGTRAPSADLKRILGIDTITKLRALTDGIIKNVDEDLVSIQAAYDTLRAAMGRLYPKRPVVAAAFGQQKPPVETPERPQAGG